MKCHCSLNMSLKIWCAKIDPKLNKLQKMSNFKKKCPKCLFSEDFSNSILFEGQS